MTFEPEVVAGDGYRIEAKLPQHRRRASRLPISSSRESAPRSLWSSEPWKPRPFHKSEKLDPHLSRRPRSCLRAHTNKREPSSEGASFDGGFEMALTATEAMAAAGGTCR